MSGDDWMKNIDRDPKPEYSTSDNLKMYRNGFLMIGGLLSPICLLMLGFVFLPDLTEIILAGLAGITLLYFLYIIFFGKTY